MTATMDNTIDPDLAQFDEDWAATQPGSPAAARDDVPDGEYPAIVERLEKRTWRDKPQVSWRFTIDGPAYGGRKLFRDVEVNKANLTLIMGDLHKVGLQLAKLSDLPAKAGDVLGKRVMVAKKTNAKGFANVYINGLAADDIDPSVPF